MKYNHTTDKHNQLAPSEIVPFIVELIKPKSVVDVGCGLGSFLKVFKAHGVDSVLGLDGSWCKKELLFKNIDQHEFLEVDLEKRLPKTIGRFDLTVSVEVAEHLSAARAESFVKDLTELSDIIIFSAAIPGQGGDNHINEQWLDYWESKFKDRQYKMVDILRPKFWNNEKIFWWYRQNMVLFIKEGYHFKNGMDLPANPVKRLVHPGLFSTIMDYRDKNAIKRYLKLLYKAVLFKSGFTK